MPEGREIPSLLCSLKGISLPLSDLEQEKTKPEGYSAMSAPRSSYKSKIVNHTVYVIIDRLEPLDENAGHCQAELGARFSIMAHLPIEAFEVRPLTRFRHGAIQHARQFFVRHPDLRHGCPLVDLIEAVCSKPRTVVLGTNILNLS